MEVSQHISVTGMLAAQRQLEAVANNLANVGTPGFKRAHAHVQDIGYQAELTAPVGPGGAPLRIVGIGEGAQIADITHDFLPGTLQATGNALDVALQGEGFFQVALADGTLGYTRDGSLSLDADGRLVTATGLPVQATTGGELRVPAGASNVRLDDTGALLVTADDGTDQVVGELAVATFSNSLGLQADGQNVWLATAASGPATLLPPGAPNAPLMVAGALEGSNVDVADEFTRLIQAQRSYQLNAKVVQAWDDIEHLANELRSGA
ncbi:MAG TPA: flagellar hook-basal body protein [Chloroflexota bacterium]|nr:flagellar hook-basal body protein [Chloroflexota bacterium]